MFCRTSGCVKEVREPFVYCFKCNHERKKSLTGSCEECVRPVHPDYSICYSCLKKNQAKKVLRENFLRDTCVRSD